MIDTYRTAVKYIPAWFPGAGFKRQAIEWRKIIETSIDMPADDLNKAIVSG